jgi:transcriptional regulator with XRE-family HTH domain
MYAVAIKSRREFLGISQEELAARAEVSPSLIAKIERGAHSPENMKLKNFTSLLDALSWNQQTWTSATGIATFTDAAQAVEPTARIVGYTRHPISYYANGGKPVDALDYVFVRDDERKHLRPGTRFAIVVGDSMTDPLDPYGEHSLRESEVAWVDSNLKDPVDGEVFLIALEGTTGETIKQLERVGSEWWCRSYNRTSHPTFALEDETRIIGRVYRKQPGSTPYKARK